ncbi:MAG: DUF1956 domain-containing protein [Alphaproteobacteria bacterium]|nr:DUF1956 domain-containing protein [Alphaproteobacteria bacterium]
MEANVVVDIGGSAETAENTPTSRAVIPTDSARSRGRPGGDDSRARILASAGKLFAARGYNGVSMRELARSAKVNLGAVNYHFGGKAKLYHETVLKLIEDVGPVFGPIIERLCEDVETAAGDRVLLSRCVANFIEGMFASVLGKRSMRWQMEFLLREFHQPSREFPTILAERISPMHDAVAGLLSAALERNPKDPEVLVRTQAFIGQIMSFGTCRAVVCARLDWNDYSRDRIAFIAATMIPATLA